jgi:RimJ/RimL family protein N-acetyltransferase
VTTFAQIETPRLLLRRWRSEDEEPMAAINGDPDVMRYINSPTAPVDTRRLHAVRLAHWEDHGFGHFAVESREPDGVGELLGFAGVAHPTFLPALAHRPEIGWRLARPAWGRGLATEAAAAARDHAFDVLELGALISIIHPDNSRSQRVAIKLGMELEGRVHNPVHDTQVDVWKLARPAGSGSPASNAAGA